MNSSIRPQRSEGPSHQVPEGLSIDPDKIRIPAFLRNKAIVRQAKQQLILTALDRKMAGLGVHSRKPLAAVFGKNGSLNIIKNNFPENKSGNKRTNFNKKRVLKNANAGSLNNEISISNNSIPAGAHLLVVPIGTVIDYYGKIHVAVLRLKETLRVGDIIQIAADNMFFQQHAESMQINRKPVKMAKKNAEIGLKVVLPPQVNGTVYKVVSAESKKAATNKANPGISKTFAQPLF